jgi:hypothetical protein
VDLLLSRPDSEKLLNEPEHRHLKLDFRREMMLFLEATWKEAMASAMTAETGRTQTDLLSHRTRERAQASLDADAAGSGF